LVHHTITGKIYQHGTIYVKWPYNIPTSSIAGPYKIYLNCDFGCENIPFGNPGRYNGEYYQTEFGQVPAVGRRLFEHFLLAILEQFDGLKIIERLLILRTRNYVTTSKNLIFSSI
jgi:hypothetical protein